MNDWQRLEKIAKDKAMSINKLAFYIGLKRSENLYQIKKGNHGISKSLAKKINQTFPEYSISWILTGESENKPESKSELTCDFEMISAIAKCVPDHFEFDLKIEMNDIGMSSKITINLIRNEVN